MPPEPRTQCKVEGCPNPPHITPGGYHLPYCRDHMHLRKAKTRDGQPSMTGPRLDVLRYLRVQKAKGSPFVELRYPLAHGITISKLLEREWIDACPRIDGTMEYCITKAGEDALDLYEPRRQRRDGLCPHCGIRPHHITKSGNKAAHCRECERERARQRYLRGDNIGAGLCSHCRKRERHVYPSGRYSTYCSRCDSLKRRRNHRKNTTLLFEAILNGAPIPLCKCCKQRPRHVAENSISSWCEICGPVERRRKNLTRVFKAKGLLSS